MAMLQEAARKYVIHLSKCGHTDEGGVQAEEDMEYFSLFS